MLYQVDCSIASSGKRVPVSKRRVRWRWGIANNNAIKAGATGVDCRGSEHEVTLVWSVTSGKRLVLQDGKEVHFSVGRRTEGEFRYSWNPSGVMNNHILTIVAHAAPPLSPKAGFKQFDMLIDGASFSGLKRIYELGQTDNSLQLTVSKKRNFYDTPPPTREEEQQWADRIIQFEKKRQMNHLMPVISSNNETRPYRPSTAPSPTISSSSTLTTRPSSTMSSHCLISDPPVTRDADLLSAPLYGEQSHFTTRSDEFLPLDPSRAPSYDTILSSIMDAYDSGIESQTPSVRSAEEKFEPQEKNDVSAKSVQASKVLQIQTENLHKVRDIVSPCNVCEIDGAMENLVNLDDLLSPVLDTKLTMNPIEDKSVSVGLPAKSSRMGHLGPQLTLSQLKNIPGHKKSSEEVMKFHTQGTAPQPAGAVVLYNHGQAYTNYSTV